MKFGRLACFGRPQVDLVEQGPREVGLLELCPEEDGTPQVGPMGARLPQDGVREVRALGHDALEVGLGEVGPREVGTVRRSAPRRTARWSFAPLKDVPVSFASRKKESGQVRLVEVAVLVGHAVEDRLR